MGGTEMVFHKTARKIHKCGDCIFFDKTQNACTHEKMNGKRVEDYQEWQCDDGQYFKSSNDYEEQ